MSDSVVMSDLVPPEVINFDRGTLNKKAYKRIAGTHEMPSRTSEKPVHKIHFIRNRMSVGNPLIFNVGGFASIE